jgi:hypothetical protein
MMLPSLFLRRRLIMLFILFVGIVQCILGLLYLLVPHQFLNWMGHSDIANDLAYPLGMLSSRFLIYGALLIWMFYSKKQNRLLVQGMLGIQLIDLCVGIFYTIIHVVSLNLSGFPMFNAMLISVVLASWLYSNKKID